MDKINRDMIKDFNWGQCSFCKNVHPKELGLRNPRKLPRINTKTGLCTNCEKIKKKSHHATL